MTTKNQKTGINREILNAVNKSLKENRLFLEEKLSDLQIHDYRYTTCEAIEELGLDSDLVDQLVEDYVAQIIKSKALFLSYIEELKQAKEDSKELDYTPLRELAHKNLGVARNLRIVDAKKVLDKLMREDDLEYLSICVEALESCAIKLRPKCAYETLKLIKVKNSI